MDLFETFTQLNKLYEEYKTKEEEELQKFLDAGAPIIQMTNNKLNDLLEDYFINKSRIEKHFRDHVESEDGRLPEELAFPRSWCGTINEYLAKALDLAKADIQGFVGDTHGGVSGYVIQQQYHSTNWQRGEGAAHYSNGDNRPDKNNIWTFCKYRWNTAIKNKLVKDTDIAACETVYYIIEGNEITVKSYMLKSYYKIKDEVKSTTRAHNADKDAGTRTDSRFANEFDPIAAAKGATRTPRCLSLSLIKDTSDRVGVHFYCTNNVLAAQTDYANNNMSFLCCFFQGSKIQKLSGNWISSRAVNKESTRSDLYKLAIGFSRSSRTIDKIRSKIISLLSREDYIQDCITDQEMVDFINNALNYGESQWQRNHPNKSNPKYPEKLRYLYKEDFSFDYYGD